MIVHPNKINGTSLDLKYAKGYKMHQPKLFIILSILLLSSCVAKFVPVEQGNVIVSNEFAVLTTDSEFLAVRIDLWNGEPQYLTDYFDVMFVRLQNRTNNNLKIEPNFFALLDENGLQFDIVPTDIVLEIILSNPTLIPERFSISSETQRENQARIATIRRNILTRAFVFGDIHQNAFKEGILFFPKINSKNQEFTIVYKNNEILFRKTK